MDVFDYRTSRTLNTEGVFTVLKTDSETGGLFMRLKNIMTSELHLQWDIAFLEQYVKENMVPRGLRWDVHPQQGDPDLESWYQFFNLKGVSLLNFLIDRKKTRLSNLDREIKEIKEKLIPFKSTTEYITLSASLKIHLEKEEREQKHKKQKKYTRDSADYGSHSIFSWQNKENTGVGIGPLSVEMDVSQPSTNEAKVLTFSQSIPTSGPPNRDIGYSYYSGPRTPNQSQGGPPPRTKGKGKGPRRGSHRSRDPSREHHTNDYSPRRRNESYYHPPRGYGTPGRGGGGPYTPRKDYPPRHYDPYYGYLEREEDHFDRPPYNYNQVQPNYTQSGDFHKGQGNHPKGGEPNGGREGGGAPGRKRPRT